MTEIVLLELVLYIPPDRLMRLGEDDQVPHPPTERFGDHRPEVAFGQQIADARHNRPAFQPLRQETLRLVQHFIPDIEEHIARRPGGNQQIPSAVGLQETLHAREARIGVQENRLFRFDLHGPVVGGHQEQDPLPAHEDRLEEMLHDQQEGLDLRLDLRGYRPVLMAQAVDLIEIKMVVGGLLLLFQQPPHVHQRLGEGLKAHQFRAPHDDIRISGRRVIPDAKDKGIHLLSPQRWIESAGREKPARVQPGGAQRIPSLIAGKGE